MQCAAFVLAANLQVAKSNGALGLLTAFSMLFVTTMSTTSGVYTLAGIYGVIGLWWLMTGYWDHIQSAFPAANVERCYPIRSGVLLMVVLGALAIAGMIRTGSASTYVLRGFMPN